MSRDQLTCLIACLLVGAPLALGLIAFSSFDAFAHNDDFLYARTTEILVNEGRYQHVSQHGKLAASVASHCVWGAAVCAPLGFSYDHLHLSVALAAWMGAVFVLLTIRELGGRLSVAFLSAIGMVVGPFYYGMSFTFMTDVTAVAFACAALLGYVKGIMRESTAWILFGAVGASLAMWARQTHLCVIVVPAVALAGLAWQQKRLRDLIVPALLACGIPVLSYVVFELGLLVPGNEGRVGIVDVDSYDAAWLRQLVLFTYAGALLTGMALLPLLPLMLADAAADRSKSRLSWALLIAAAVMAGGIFASSWGRAYITQATGYIIYNAHLGPILLGDQNDPGRWSDMGGVRWPSIVWQAVTVLSIVAFALAARRAGEDLVVRSDASQEEQRRRWLLIAMIVCILAATVGLLSYVKMVYDRYWMLLYPMLFCWLGASLGALVPRRRVSLASVSLTSGLLAAGLFCVSFVFVHDFLAWNHARLAQVNEWLGSGLEPRDFDAGNGINGWFRSAEDYRTHGRDGDDTAFWRGHATHSLAIGPREGWTVTGKRSWYSWAVARECELYVLEKTR